MYDIIAQNDRLKRWLIVDTSTPGVSKRVVAENIRTEAEARFMCDAMNAAIKWIELKS